MTSKPIFKNADELIALMLESKKQSKKESEAFSKTKEFKEILKRLKEKKSVANELSI
jgi:hypothetical protein